MMVRPALDAPEGSSGLDAVLAMLRAALGAGAAVAVARRGAVCLPIAAAGSAVPGAFATDRVSWTAQRTDGLVLLAPSALPVCLLPLLETGAAQAALLVPPADSDGVTTGGILLLWPQPRPLAGHEPVAAALAPRLPQMIRDHESARLWQQMRVRFEDLLASIPIGLVFTDARSEDCLVNAAAADLLGCPPGIIAPADLAQRMQALRRRCANADSLEKGIIVALAHPHARATEIWDLDDRLLSVESRPLLGNGQFGRVWIFEDVTTAHRARTQLERLAADLRLARDQAQAANAAKSAFLATMSHEIRTPLNAVLGFADLLRDTPLSDEQRTFVDLQYEAGRSLLAIINDILDFSKIEAGRLAIDPHPFDLRRVLEGCLGMVRTTAQDKGLSLDLDVAADVPAMVVGDGLRLRQVLLNLLSNAVKFTAVGSIRVQVQGDPGPDGVWNLLLRVEDTGIGIPMEKAGQLFEPFTQADASTTRHFGGTGLGLAICRRLIQAMGGDIGLTPRPGGGSCFWFTLPLPAGSDLDPADAGALSRPALPRRGRILVVDDLRANQILVSAMLRKAGQQVILADNGLQAVEVASRGGFDLVLMDVQMPVMDGLEASRRIRALDGPVGQVPIVALTAAILPEELARCRDAGMNGHVAKPVNQDDLLHKTMLWLDAAPQPETAEAGEQAMAALPDIDMTVLDLIADTVGQTTLEQIVAAAHPALRADLAQLAEAPEPEGVARAAHRLVSTAGNLGFRGLADLARRLDQAAKAGDRVGMAALIPQIQAEGVRAERWLATRFPVRPDGPALMG